MKFEDSSQNLRARLRFVQVLVILMLCVLTVRLYVLQVVRHEKYAEIAENQRRRRLPIPAPRGVIFDREGKVLVDSRPIYNVILSREDLQDKKLHSLIEPLAAGLNVEKEILRERFDLIDQMAAFESIKVKEDADPGDISWVEAHAFEHPLHARLFSARYRQGETAEPDAAGGVFHANVGTQQLRHVRDHALGRLLAVLEEQAAQIVIIEHQNRAHSQIGHLPRYVGDRLIHLNGVEIPAANNILDSDH